MSNDGNDTSKHKSDPHVEQLLREGIAASKMGDKATARAKLQEVVALDQYNEMGWFWLASVVETDDEKRACLGNVVVINPNNERAQHLLNQLTDATLGLAGPVRDDLVLGRTAWLREHRNVVIVGGIAVVVLLLLAALFSGKGNGPVQPTFAVIAKDTAIPPTDAAVLGTEGATASPTINPKVATLPPSWTPSPESNSGGGATPLASPPPDLTGELVVAQGGLIAENGSLPIVTMDPYGQHVRKVSQDDVGDYGILTPDGQRLIYSRFLAGTNSQTLRAMTSIGTQGTELSTMWNNSPPLANMEMPAISRNGGVLVFSATTIVENDGSPDIYMLPAQNIPPFDLVVIPTPESGDVTEAPSATPTLLGGSTPTESAGRPVVKFTRVTEKDSGNNTWPSVSPDGNFVVFVRDSQPLGEDSIDLYIVGIGGESPKKLTTDGMTNVEAAPEWSPDGKLIAYQSRPTDVKTSDIYVINADGTNPVKLTDGEGDNVRPHWSPDGKYLAFSSNRAGRWQVFIMDVATKTTYQVTTGKTNSICTSWGIK